MCCYMTYIPRALSAFLSLILIGWLWLPDWVCTLMSDLLIVADCWVVRSKGCGRNCWLKVYLKWTEITGQINLVINVKNWFIYNQRISINIVMIESSSFLLLRSVRTFLPQIRSTNIQPTRATLWHYCHRRRVAVWHRLFKLNVVAKTSSPSCRCLARFHKINRGGPKLSSPSCRCWAPSFENKLGR